MTQGNRLDNLSWPAPRPPSAELSRSIAEHCQTGLKPSRPASVHTRVLVSIALSGILFGTLLVIGWRRHPPHTAVGIALLGALLWGVIQASVLIVGFGRPPGRRGSRLLRWGVVGIVPVVFFAHLTSAATNVLSLEQFFVVPRSLRSTVVCGVHSLLFGALASVALFALWRRSDPFSPRLTGAVTGLAGGLVGAIALDMTCPSLEAMHLWLGHGLTLVTLVVAGWFAGRRWLAP